MQFGLYLDPTLRRQSLPGQTTQPPGRFQQLEHQALKGDSNVPQMAATATAVSGITRPHLNYAVSGFPIPNSAEPNAYQGHWYTFNEKNVIYVDNNDFLLSNSAPQYSEQVFSEVKSAKNEDNDCQELFSSLSLVQDAHSLSSSTNFLGVTYTSDMRAQCPDDKEQGAIPLGGTTGVVGIPCGEGISVSATPTQSTKENPRSSHASNSVYSNTNLFVRFTPHTMDEEQLVKLFSPYGKIESRVIMRNIHTGANMGVGFVRFETHEQAEKAMIAMNNPLKPGTHYNMAVQWAKREHDNVPTGKDRWRLRKLFVRNIPQDVTTLMLENLFQPYGELERVSLHRDTSAAAQSASHQRDRRIAFVTYRSEGVAQEAFKAVHNTFPFLSCERIPLMVKLVEDNPIRPQKHNCRLGSPTHQWLPKKNSMVSSGLNKEGVTHEDGSNATAFAISTPGNLYCPANNNPNEHTKNPLNAMQSGQVSSPLLNSAHSFETSDAVCANYSSPMEVPLAYAQIPLPQPLPVTSIPFTFNSPEHSFVQAFKGNSGGSNNPKIGSATVLSSDMVHSGSSPQGGIVYYNPQSSPFRCTGSANWYATTAATPLSYTQATSNTGNAFHSCRCANTTMETQPITAVTAFSSLGDTQHLASCKTSQASQTENSHSGIQSLPLSLPLDQNKNMNEMCLRFGEIIEKLHHLSVANQESSVLTPTDVGKTLMVPTAEKGLRSSFGADVGCTDVAGDEKSERPFSAVLSSASSSGMMCFPSYTNSESTIPSSVSHTSGLNIDTSQTTGAASCIRNDVRIGDLSVWTTNPMGPRASRWALDEFSASQPKPHKEGSSALVVEDLNESINEDVQEGERFRLILNSIASDTS